MRGPLPPLPVLVAFPNVGLFFSLLFVIILHYQHLFQGVDLFQLRILRNFTKDFLLNYGTTECFNLLRIFFKLQKFGSQLIALTFRVLQLRVNYPDLYLVT